MSGVDKKQILCSLVQLNPHFPLTNKYYHHIFRIIILCMHKTVLVASQLIYLPVHYARIG